MQPPQPIFLARDIVRRLIHQWKMLVSQHSTPAMHVGELMLPDEIRQEIANGNLSAITLDTTVFDRNSLKFDTGLIKRIEQFYGTSVDFVLSEIVMREVLSHLKNHLTDSQYHLSNAINDIRKWWHLSADDSERIQMDIFGGSTPDTAAKVRIGEFLRGTGCQIVRLDEQPILSDIVKRYFGSKPPFAEKKDKKHEFPDAMALLSLDAWAKLKGTKMLVVSNDDGWKKYCEESERLIAVDDLADALSYFQNDVAIACEVLSLRMARNEVKDDHETVRQAIEAQVYMMDFAIEACSPYHYEEELTEVDVDDFSFDTSCERFLLKPVEYSDEMLVTEVRVNVLMSISCEFSFSTWDSIDKEYIPIGSSSGTANREVGIRLLLTFTPTAEGHNLSEVEVISRGVAVDFGEVGPDWGEPNYIEPDWDAPPDPDENLPF